MTSPYKSSRGGGGGGVRGAIPVRNYIPPHDACSVFCRYTTRPIHVNRKTCQIVPTDYMIYQQNIKINIAML